MEKKVQIICGILLLFFVFYVSADSISDELHLNIQTINSSGDVVSGTFNFQFNITADSTCSNVVYSNSTSLTTDSRGIISYYLENVNINFTDQYWLCYYRDGILINASKIVRNPYSFLAKNVSAYGVMDDSNLNLEGHNVSASFFVGDGSQLTGISTDNSSWNETYASGLYAPNTSAGIQDLINGTNVLFANADFNSGWQNGGVSISGGNIFAQLLYVYNITSLNVNNLFMNGSFFPSFDNSFDLGSGVLSWKDLFLSGQVYSNGTGNNYFLGSLGIGTSNPTHELNVVGDLNVTKNVFSTNLTADNLVNKTSVNINFWSSLLPFRDGVFDLGSATRRLSNLYAAKAIIGSGESHFYGGTYSDPHSGQGYAIKAVGTGVYEAIAASGNVVVVGGNLGVGTTSPGQNLTVVGDGNFTGDLFVNGINITNSLDGGVNATFNQSFTDSLYAPNTSAGIQGLINGTTVNFQRVGIGTSTPSNILEVRGTTDVYGQFNVYSNGAIAQAFLRTFVNSIYSSEFAFYKSRNDTEGVYSETLDNDRLGVIDWYGVTSLNGLGWAATIRAEQEGSSTASRVPSRLMFLTSDGIDAPTERVRIDNHGSVGIGVTSPAYRLEVSGNVSLNNSLFVNDNGNVGIGVKIPSQKLEVNGTVNFTGDFFVNGINITASLGTPQNAIMAFNQDTCPTGWILADGTSGTPDLRGIFIRGAGTNGVISPSNSSYSYTATYGTYQNDSIQGHRHEQYSGALISTGAGPDRGLSATTNTNIRASDANGEPITNGSSGDSRTSYETAPASYALIYCMKTGEDSATSNTIWGISGDNIVQNNASKNVVLNGNLTVGGSITLNGVSRVRANRATAQSIPDSTYTILQYTAEDFDNLGEFNGTAFIVRETGYYQVTGSVMFESVVWTLGKNIYLRIYKNGVLGQVLDHEVTDATTSLYGVHGTDIIYLSAGDFIDFRVYQNRGSATNLQATADTNYIAIHRLS